MIEARIFLGSDFRRRRGVAARVMWGCAKGMEPRCGRQGRLRPGRPRPGSAGNARKAVLAMRPHPSYRHDNFASELEGRRSAERRTVHGPHCIGRCRQRTMPGAAAGIVEARSPSGALTAALATGCHPDGSAPDPCFLGRGSEGCFARLRPVLSPASSSRSGRSAGRWCPGAARERIATPRAGTALASRSGVPREHVPHRRGDPPHIRIGDACQRKSDEGPPARYKPSAGFLAFTLPPRRAVCASRQRRGRAPAARTARYGCVAPARSPRAGRRQRSRRRRRRLPGRGR